MSSTKPVAASSRPIKKRKAGQTPAPLTELCHDTLANGVLQVHDGLPTTWLAMFKAHPVAWQQLQDAVVKSIGRQQEEWLTEDSTVMIFYIDENCVQIANRYRTFPVPATALPKWLYVLLEGFFKALYFSAGVWFARYPLKDGMGAYQVDMSRLDATENIFLKICSICDHAKGALHELYSDTVSRLVKHLGLSTENLFSDKLSWVDEDGDQHEYEHYKGMCHEELMGEFPEVIRDAVRTALHEAETWFLDVNWADTMYVAHEELNADANIIRAPFATLYFKFEA